jgi:uncharacterized protein (TIGR01244 family)
MAISKWTGEWAQVLTKVAVSMDQLVGRCWHSSEELKSSFAVNATARFSRSGVSNEVDKKGKTMKIYVLALATLGSAIISATQPQQAPEFPSIPNFLMVNDQFFVGGQPPMEDFARLKTKGIRVIVNLRHPAEYNAAEEEAKVKELGLRYFNIPVNPGDLRDAQVEQFLSITSDRHNLSVFIHCTMGVRVATFWMIRRVLVDGWKIEDAENEARNMGLRNPVLLEFAKGYIARHPKKDIK